MLHFGLVVLIQAAILDVDASATAKFLFVTALGIVLAFGIAHVSRWVPGLRTLLGTAPGSERARHRPELGTAFLRGARSPRAGLSWRLRA